MIPVPDDVLHALIHAYGAEPAAFEYFAGGQTFSDGVLYAGPIAGARRLIKILALPEAEAGPGLFRFEARLRFAHYLGEHGASLAFPRPSPQGHLYETHRAADHLWVATAMDIVPGRTPRAERRDPAFFRNWGQALGRMHRLARGYPSWRASVDPETGESALTWEEEWVSFRDWCQEDDVRARWVDLRAELGALPVTRASFGFIHNDPHLWNLQVDGDRVTVLDFDVANHHWFVNDLAIACQSVLFVQSGGLDRPVSDRGALLGFLSHLLEGYRRDHTLDPVWLGRLDLFIAYRRILLFIVMYDDLIAKPARHARWKRMIMDRPAVVDDHLGG
jgi:Ser/Thr protein kinase RdoA (MazF antagonist)